MFFVWIPGRIVFTWWKRIGILMNLTNKQTNLSTCSCLVVFRGQADPWNSHVWKGVNGTPTKKRAIGFKKLAKWVGRKHRDKSLPSFCLLLFIFWGAAPKCQPRYSWSQAASRIACPLTNREVALLSPSNLHQCTAVTPLLSLWVSLVDLSSVFSRRLNLVFFLKLNLDFLFKDGSDSPNSWSMSCYNALQLC